MYKRKRLSGVRGCILKESRKVRGRWTITVPSSSKLRGLHCTAESERAWNSISNICVWRRWDTSIGGVGEVSDDGPLESASSAPLTWSFRGVILTRLACEDQKGNPNSFVSNQLVKSWSQGLDTNLCTAWRWSGGRTP
jgi:hypothetical protein